MWRFSVLPTRNMLVLDGPPIIDLGVVLKTNT
jgi:hypothetical protein